MGGDIVGQLSGHHVLVIGDLMIDEYLRGDVQRISPEAPVPVLEVRGIERRLGGAANTAANIQRLGGKAAVIGVVGDDLTAHAMRDHLRDAGVKAVACVDPSRPTTKKTRLVAQTQQIVRIDEETRKPLDGEAAAALLAAVRAEAANVAAIVLSDYEKGVITAEVAETAIAVGRKRGIPVVVDPKQRDFAIYRGSTVITPNLHELERAASLPVHNKAEIEAAVAKVRAVVAGASLLVTRGADGMTLYRDQQPPHHVPSAARDVFDVTGAGDTVVAALSLALAAGVAIEAAVDLATVAAGISVSKRGTSTVSPEELAGAIAAWRR